MNVMVMLSSPSRETDWSTRWVGKSYFLVLVSYVVCHFLFSFLFLGGLVPVMLCYFASLQMSFAIDLAFGEKVCMDCLLLNMDVTGQQHRWYRIGKRTRWGASRDDALCNNYRSWPKLWYFLVSLSLPFVVVFLWGGSILLLLYIPAW